MPISSYDSLFGGKGDTKGSAQKILSNLIKEYGDKRGKAMFYGMVAKRKRLKGSGNSGKGQDSKQAQNSKQTQDSQGQQKAQG